MSTLIITIDGPAGSGKSTVAAKLAARLQIAYLDTGAMYRAVTLTALRRGTDLEDQAALARLAGEVQIAFSRDGDRSVVRLDGEDVSEAIRTQEVTDHAHYLAGAPAVRAVLVQQQQRIGTELGSLVTEGRDQGTVVFPDAPFKFYLDATAECRARRRWLQLQKKDPTVKLEDILAAQQQRDARDTGRAVGPLRASDDAIIVDTSDMTVEQVVECLHQRVTEGE